MASFNDGDGVWRTISGRHIFIRNGQSISSAMKASGKFKKTGRNKKTVSKTPNTISKEEYDKMPRDYKGTLRELVDTAEFRGENKAELIKQYTDKGYDVDKDKTVLSLEKGGTTLKPVKIEEKSTSNSNEIKYRFKDDNGKIITPSEEFKKLNGGFYVKQNKDGTAAYISSGKRGDGSIDYTRYDYDKNGNAGKGKTYKSLDEAKAGGSKNEFTREELKSKYGTDNTDVINAGKEKGDRVSLKSENKKEFHYAGEELYSDDPNRFGDTMRKYNEKMNPSVREPLDYRYRLLDRLRTDNEYYLGNGGRAKKHLWAGDEEKQINKMKEIYNSFKENERPNWLTEKDIDEYAKKMGVKTNSNNNGDWLRNAYNEYKKQHPNTKMSFNTFKKNNQ